MQDKLYSKSETIGMADVRKLMEVSDKLNFFLTEIEYQNIMAIYLSAIERLIAENEEK